MRLLAIGVEHALDVAVQRSHEPMRANIVGPTQRAARREEVWKSRAPGLTGHGGGRVVRLGWSYTQASVVAKILASPNFALCAARASPAHRGCQQPRTKDSGFAVESVGGAAASNQKAATPNREKRMAETFCSRSQSCATTAHVRSSNTARNETRSSSLMLALRVNSGTQVSEVMGDDFSLLQSL
jgi:hypothetical protein